jgi:hypothetical protein
MNKSQVSVWIYMTREHRRKLRVLAAQQEKTVGEIVMEWIDKTTYEISKGK